MSLRIVASAAERVRATVPTTLVLDQVSEQRVEGTGTSIIEVVYGGSWGPTPNNARHHVVQVNVLADRTRDVHGLPVKDDADRNAYALWLRIDPLLNDVDHAWSAVHSSRRANGPTLTNIPDSDGAVMLTARYEVSCD